MQGNQQHCVLTPIAAIYQYFFNIGATNIDVQGGNVYF